MHKNEKICRPWHASHIFAKHILINTPIQYNTRVCSCIWCLREHFYLPRAIHLCMCTLKRRPATPTPHRRKPNQRLGWTVGGLCLWLGLCRIFPRTRRSNQQIHTTRHILSLPASTLCALDECGYIPLVIIYNSLALGRQFAFGGNADVCLAGQ